MTRRTRVAAAGVLAGAAATISTAGPAALAAPVVLYNGSLGTTPDAQPWLTYASVGAGTETVGNGGVTLDTTSANGNYAGYSNDYATGTVKNAAFPVLDPVAGFDLSFTADLTAESHASNDRAGFSVILLGHNHLGVELGFWAGQVWAQSGPTFTHAEGSTGLDPTAGFESYDLAIRGGAYTLSANGAVVLSGATHDFSGEGGLPYTLADYVFLGDDTSSAAASVQLRSAAVTVPEPAVAGLCAAGLALAGCRGRRRRVR